MNDVAKHAPALAGYPVVISIPIQWGDQDAFGHVNGVVYFRWFESSRVEYFNRSGLGHVMNNQGVGPILASIKCDYRRQLKHPDTVHIGGRITGFGRTSMRMSHAIYSESQQAIAAEGESVVVMFDYLAQRPAQVPEEVKTAIERLQNGGLKNHGSA